MRVALVHLRHAATGGTERYLNHLARHLAEAGDEVTIVCRRHGEPPHPAVRFERLHGFALGGGWRQWSFARSVEAHVRRAGYDVVFGLGKTWTHDVVRLGGGLAATYLELAHRDTLTPLERLAGKGWLKHRLALAIERRALAPGAYRRVIANSKRVLADAQARHGVPPELGEVIYNGVDLERFHPRRRGADGAALRRELGLSDTRVALFLGTGYGRKGLDLVLEAWPSVLARAPGSTLLVVGFDSSQAHFEARARRLDLGQRVRFLGGRRDPEVAYGAADLYVLPTRYDPFANSTLEALASGLPVITSTANGAAELLADSGAGTVVPPAADPVGEALADWLARSEDELDDGRRAARGLAEAHGIESKMERTSALLRELGSR